jgi:peptidoglycan/xylan/chitin deacetylase (PgdA/CDA1 family)
VHPWLRDGAKELLQRLILRRRFTWHLSANTRDTALTFDDGPHPEFTPAILDALAESGVKATFFVIGNKVDQHPKLVQRIVSEGHGIGNHTYDHREFVGLPRAELDVELARGRQSIRDACGVDTLLLRPPRGRLDLNSLRTAAALGYHVVHWTWSYSDYRCDGVQALLGRFAARPVRPRDIILLHDHNEHTVAALRHLLPQWRSAGLRFCIL